MKQQRCAGFGGANVNAFAQGHLTTGPVGANGVLRSIHMGAVVAPFFDVVIMRTGVTDVPPDCIHRESETVIRILGDQSVRVGHTIGIVVENRDVYAHRFFASLLYDADVPEPAHDAVCSGCLAPLPPGPTALPNGHVCAPTLPQTPAPPVVHEPRCRCGELLSHEKHHWGPCPTPRPADAYGRPAHRSSGVEKRRER